MVNEYKLGFVRENGRPYVPLALELDWFFALNMTNTPNTNSVPTASISFSYHR